VALSSTAVRRRETVQLGGFGRHSARQCSHYADAQRLGLVDSRIAALVATMNVPHLMHTSACCEGHGRWGSFSSPYIAFEAPVELAAILHESLQGDLMQQGSRLNFNWSVEGCFGGDRQIVFRLVIQGIDRYRWVSRNRLDGDISVVREMVLDAISQFRGAI